MINKIVVVDDDRVTVSMLERVLTQHGYLVFTAGDGASGYELVKKEKPEILISDMLLPKIHGIDLCKKVKEDPELEQIKVVLITAVYKSAAFMSDIKSCGADHYFEKPINMQGLLNWIEGFSPKIPEIEKTDEKKPEEKVEPPEEKKPKPDKHYKPVDVEDLMSELEEFLPKKKKKKE